MKKLLGLLAVAPMALAACGGTETTTAASTGHIQDGSAVKTAYYLGHGQNNHDSYAKDANQNTSYQVIEAVIFENDSDELSFVINESVGYHAVTTVADSAKATPEWTKLTDTTEGILGSVIATAGFDKDADDADIDPAVTYSNTGQSQRYVYDVETVDVADISALFHDTTFVAKTRDNYGFSSGFDFVMNKESWQAHLNGTYNTCAKVNAVKDADIKTMAETKGAMSGISGATASETGLYLAAAIATAKTHCTA